MDAELEKVENQKSPPLVMSGDEVALLKWLIKTLQKAGLRLDSTGGVNMDNQIIIIPGHQIDLLLEAHKEILDAMDDLLCQLGTKGEITQKDAEISVRAASAAFNLYTATKPLTDARAIHETKPANEPGASDTSETNTG